MPKQDDPFNDAIESIRAEAVRIGKQYAPQLQNIITEATLAVVKDGLKTQAVSAAFKAAKREETPVTEPTPEPVADAPSFVKTEATTEAASTDELSSRLRALTQLHADGIINDEEYSLAKQAVLTKF